MGREFIDLFEEWSKSYDDTVGGHDIEYQEVFKHYDGILTASPIGLLVMCWSSGWVPGI